MDIPEVDRKPSNTKNDQVDPNPDAETKLRVDIVKQHPPVVLVSSPSDRVIMASGDQLETPVISPAASPRGSSTEQRQPSDVSTSNDVLATADTSVSATASSTVQPDKSDQPSLTVSVSANPIGSTASDATQPQLSNTSTTVTSDTPQRPMSSSTDSGTKVKEESSRSSVTSHHFFPDLETSQSHEHTDSASMADSSTHEDTSSSKDEKLILEKIRSDMTLGGNSAIGPSTSGWTTDSEDSDKKDEDLFPTEVSEETMLLARRRQMTQDSLSQVATTIMAAPNTMQRLLGKTAEKHYDDAEEHIKVKQYEKAVNCLNKAINLQPKTVLYYVERAEIFLHLCDFSSAILNYKRACVLEPDNYSFYCRLAFLYFFYGQCLFDQNLFPEALESFSRAAEMRPEVTGYHMRSISCLAALHRHGECLALVNKRLETDRENADLYILRARLHKLFRNITLCYYDVKDALSISPEHVEAKKLMRLLQARAQTLKTQAMQLNLMGRTREALQKISIAIETDPSFADFHILRGALQRQLGDFNAAIDDFLLAMDKTDHDESSSVYKKAQRQLLLTYNDFAVECFLKGFYEEAIILLNKAIKGEKTEKGLYINRGDCFFKEGNLHFSLADYQQALEIDPTDTATKARIAVIHNEYGIQEYQAKAYQEAERRFTNAIENNPQLAQYYISRAKTRQLLENVSRARQDVLMSLHLGQSNPELIFLMTRLFPGKAVQEVLQSRAAVDASQHLQHLLFTSMPIRLAPIAPSSSADETESNASSSVSNVESVTSTIEPFVRQDNGIEAEQKNHAVFRTCMVEREFHIKIAKEKKTINNKVKTALHNRPPLHYNGARIKHIPLH